MNLYAIAWEPRTDNLGDDLRVLAASRLLPRVDLALNVNRLDEGIVDEGKLNKDMPLLAEDDRVVTILSGPLLQRGVHWPPSEPISPVCVGVHVSEEDAWGLRISELSGAGKAYLEGCAPIGCRDERTARHMESLGIPHELTACLTLTLERPEGVAEDLPYVCCVDVPESVSGLLEEFASGVGMSVKKMTHRLDEVDPDFKRRMHRAEEVVKTYAGAHFVVTRRLHCAMACLAVGTPVIMLYNHSYEDLTRFAPMDRMMHIRPVEEFVTAVRENGFPVRWKNPEGVDAWRAKLQESVRKGIADAEKRPQPIVSRQEAAEWRRFRLERMAEVGEAKLLRLEQANYDALHAKFSLIMKEDALKSLLWPLLHEPEIIKALQRIDAKRGKARKKKNVQGEEEAPVELRQQIEEALKDLGWPAL